MTPEQEARMEAMMLEMQSVRNLRPNAFALVNDYEADIKKRWTAFDELYEAINEGLLKRGITPSDITTDPMTVDQMEHANRVSVAMALLMFGNPSPEDAIIEVMKQIEVLVPAPPNEESGSPPLTMQDQALLNELTNLMRTELPEDWDCFFKGDTETAERRKSAFARMYAIIGKKWTAESLFARSLTPEQRQKMVVFAFMCHIILSPVEGRPTSGTKRTWKNSTPPSCLSPKYDRT